MKKNRSFDPGLFKSNISLRLKSGHQLNLFSGKETKLELFKIVKMEYGDNDEIIIEKMTGLTDSSIIKFCFRKFYG